LQVLLFWLDSCIANKGEKFELEMVCWTHLEGFQVVSSHFWALLRTSLTGLGQRSDRCECWSCAHDRHRSDRCELKLLQLPCFQLVCMHLSRGRCIGSGGALCVFSSFALVVCVVWTSLGPLSRWVPGPTTRWAPGTTRLALHGT
jgi:hypothetical protein